MQGCLQWGDRSQATVFRVVVWVAEREAKRGRARRAVEGGGRTAGRQGDKGSTSRGPPCASSHVPAGRCAEHSGCLYLCQVGAAGSSAHSASTCAAPMSQTLQWHGCTLTWRQEGAGEAGGRGAACGSRRSKACRCRHVACRCSAVKLSHVVRREGGGKVSPSSATLPHVVGTAGRRRDGMVVPVWGRCQRGPWLGRLQGKAVVMGCRCVIEDRRAMQNKRQLGRSSVQGVQPQC